VIRRESAGTEQGSIAVELVILAPLVGILLAGVVFVGRIQAARADVESAARSAARTLSLARDPNSMLDQVRDDAAASLHVGSATCRQLTLDAQPSRGEVVVTISCQVDLRAAAVLPVPGSMTVTARATEAVDHYREDTTP
jgi:Flp pilus assembly protein TadG